MYHSESLRYRVLVVRWDVRTKGAPVRCIVGVLGTEYLTRWLKVALKIRGFSRPWQWVPFVPFGQGGRSRGQSGPNDSHSVQWRPLSCFDKGRCAAAGECGAAAGGCGRRLKLFPATSEDVRALASLKSQSPPTTGGNTRVLACLKTTITA